MAVSNSWTPRHRALEALFSPEELARLEASRTAVSAEGRTVVYCVYENPFARAGGIAAVAAHLPPALREAGEDVVLLTPFHRNLKTTPAYSDLNRLTDIKVRFGGVEIAAELFEHFDKSGNRWVFIQAWGIFDAAGGPDRTNPYSHLQPELLLRDALFASAAAPHAVAALGIERNVVFHLQDWQFAPAALTVKQAVLEGTLESAVTVLTSHNPYDHALSNRYVAYITDRIGPPYWPLGQGTVYQRMIPLTDAPLSTVSPNFARELAEDQLQTVHFAGHLQAVYQAHGVVGVNNPLFGEPKNPYPAGPAKKIFAEKMSKRKVMLQALAAFEDERALGELDGGEGRPLTELPDEIPVFMMFGRLDPGQKGFDLLARAIEGFAPGDARFVLAPSVGEAGGPWVDDLARLAERRSGDVVVYPFRMTSGYMETMAGASFIVMPSFYEPFGAATEAYLAGTPVVARATGGLVDQVNDLRRKESTATGLLFREKLPLGSSWPSIINAPTPEERVSIPLYAMMAEALFEALKQAAEVWRDDRGVYSQMLVNLFAKATEFSGSASAHGYQEIYDIASAPRPPRTLG